MGDPYSEQSNIYNSIEELIAGEEFDKAMIG